MPRAMKPEICVFAWAPPVVSANLPRMLAQIAPRVHRAPEQRQTVAGRRRMGHGKPSQRQRPGVYCPAIVENSNGKPGETMLPWAKDSNQGRPKGPSELRASRRYNLGRHWRERLAACAVVLFLSALWASVGRAQDRAAAYAPADIRYGAQIYTAQCSACHGVNGTQIGGVDLGGALRRAPSDQDLR